MASVSARAPLCSLPPHSLFRGHPLPPVASFTATSAAVASTTTSCCNKLAAPLTRRGLVAAAMSTVLDSSSTASVPRPHKTIDSHLHVWASPQQAADKYPYHPGQEPTVRGDTDFLLEDGYQAVRFNPYLWPSGQKMINDVGKALFRKAGELHVPVGIMCMKGLGLHIEEIEELCSNFPSTVVLLDHMGFCKPPTNNDESKIISRFLELSKFPQVYVKFSALFRISRESFPYEDTVHLLSQVISSYGANRVMWGSDFPFVVPECGYKGAKEATSVIASQIPLGASDLEWIMGGTVMQLFQDCWV